jgi:hypothetical protein
MPLTNVGCNDIAAAVVGASFTPYNNANAYLGVGDSTTPFVATQTDLQASSNKLRKPMDPTYPNVSGASCVFEATFNSGDANFTWNEWGVFNAAFGGNMLSRKVETLGTKTNTQVWVLTITDAFSTP